MKPTKISLVLLFLLAFASTSFAQEIDLNIETTEGSTPTKKKTRFTKERMQAIRDSLNEVFKIRFAKEKVTSREYAVKRWEKLKANTRKDTIKALDLSWLVADKLPPEVLEFRNIKTLDISRSTITKLPKGLAKVESLETLIWTRNEIEVAEGEERKIARKMKAPRLKQVRKLYMSGSRLTEVPKFVRKFRNLTHLVLSGNEITTPKNRLRKMGNLNLLNLDENPLDLTAFNFKHIPDGLELLKFNKCDLTSVPKEIYQLKVKDLQLRENQITKLPDGIGAMTNLRKLSLYKNKLNALPSDFYELSKLESLDLYHNQLKYVAPEIQSFDSLQILYLAHNKLLSVPEEIGEMVQLRELYLHHNQLSGVPESFKKLENLQVFRINDNNLPEFPSAILTMNQLEFLDVSDNLLETIPEGLGSLSSLQQFDFDKNQIELQAVSNRHIAPMISDMIKSGVVCIPSIREVEEEVDNEDE